jgi:CheY-like chemotaxis protein
MITKQMVFLVVDDFEPMRKVTAGQLRAIGAAIILTAANGAEAMTLLHTHRVNMILSDWNMPVMTGLELLKLVRADKKLSRIPFIMITAEAERHRVDEAIAWGVSDLLVKPYTANNLSIHIEKALTVGPMLALSDLPTLPIQDAAASAIKNTQDNVHPTILVVDDTPDNLMLISNLFKDEYRVRIAHNGTKALSICQSNDPPDLVLLDIMMPGMDGLEVARRMREHPVSESIPVIFVTAMDSDEARLKGMALGAIDFVTKPIEPDVLKPRVRNFMHFVELHKQLQINYDAMLELARLREDVEHITRHDMREPLAGVIGLLQALEEEDGLSNQQIAQLRVVEETALQALNMINMSTELFKIETGRFKLNAQPVKITSILHRIVDISRSTYAGKHLIIAIDTDQLLSEETPLVLGDAMFCYSLFQNLIKNACEASPEKGRVTVTLNHVTPLEIVIVNKGAVPVEIREHFFDKFITFGKQGGTGLGTYSARLLTEAQNGTLTLNVSDPENTTTLTVTLPRYDNGQAGCHLPSRDYGAILRSISPAVAPSFSTIC